MIFNGPSEERLEGAKSVINSARLCDVEKFLIWLYTKGYTEGRIDTKKEVLQGTLDLDIKECETCEYYDAAFMPCNACEDKSEYVPIQKKE